MPSREAVDAIVHQARLQAQHLLIARRVAQFGQLLQLGQQLRRVDIQFVRARIFERVLKFGAADAILHRQILHRLHEERDAGDLRELRLQARDHVAGADFAHVQRFQVDQNAAAVERCVGAVDADERREAVHRGVLQNHLRQLLLLARHFGERYGLRAF